MSIDRRTFLLGSGTAGVALAMGLPALGKTAPVAAQVAGVQHFNVGDIVVSAISDGYIDIETSKFPAAGKEEAAAALQREFAHQPDKYRAAVNAFVARLGDRTVLIDGGTGTAMGPTLGMVPGHLAAAGIAPADVDVIAATHLHPDHVGGIVDAAGKAVYPNATLLVHEAEIEFWRDDAFRSQAPDPVKAFFDLARATLDAYQGRVSPFGKDGEVLPGLQSVHMPGHTPGHVGYMLSSGDQDLLIWGDLVHAPEMQFAHPEWSISFDVDQDLARTTRQKVFAQVAADRQRIAGMHMHFPGIGHLRQEQSGFAYVPAQWDYDLKDGK